MKRWPLNKAWFWETAPFFRLLIPLMAGIYVYSLGVLAISVELVFKTILFSFALILLTGLAKQKYEVAKYLFGSSVHIVIFFLAYGLCYQNDIRNNPSWFGKQLDAQTFVARVAAAPAEKARTWKLQVELLSTIKQGKVSPACGDALVYVYKDEKEIPFREADTLLLPAAWQRIRNAGNPFEFDYASYAARHNIYYQQFVGQDDVLRYGIGSESDISWIKQMHNWSMHRLELFIKDKPTLGLMQAMLIGDDANFDPELRQAYSETGIVHVVAISGSHITIFFVMVALLLGWVKNKKYHWLKYIIALPLIWLYVLVAGAPPSAVRAAVMFSILAAGFALQKNPNSLNQLFATAFLLLCAQPMWLFSVGFQLSFLAVLSLVLFYRPVYALVAPAHVISRALWASVAASIAAEILIAPLVIYYFHLFPLMFIIANIAAYLFMGIILVAGMLIIGFSFVPVMASFITAVTVWLVAVFNQLVFGLKQFNPASFYYANLEFYELLLVYAIVISGSVYLLKKKKGALFPVLSFVCLLLVSFCFNEWKALHQQKLVVYNISKANHIELINGKQYQIIATDTTISPKTKNYSLKPAHTGWHAWRQKTADRHELFYIGGHSVLVLNGGAEYDAQFPVDYLVLNYKARKGDVLKLAHTFQPKKIIMGANISRKRTEEWIQASKQAGIPVHAAGLQGAFVLDAFEALP